MANLEYKTTGEIEYYCYDNASMVTPNTISVVIEKPDGSTLTPINTITIGNPSTLVLTADELDIKGRWRAVWTWTYFDSKRTEERAFYVLSSDSMFSSELEGYIEEPTWESISPEIQRMIHSAMRHFEDCFDSVGGGPHLASLAKFDEEKYILLALDALSVINLQQPYSQFLLSTYPVDSVSAGVFSQCVVVEFIRHFKRAYTEQFNPNALGVAYIDRRDYVSRWDTVLTEEKMFRDHLLKNWKRTYMQFGSSKMIVAGQRYGRYWPHVRPTTWPRPRW